MVGGWILLLSTPSTCYIHSIGSFSKLNAGMYYVIVLNCYNYSYFYMNFAQRDIVQYGSTKIMGWTTIYWNKAGNELSTDDLPAVTLVGLPAQRTYMDISVARIPYSYNISVPTKIWKVLVMLRLE